MTYYSRHCDECTDYTRERQRCGWCISHDSRRGRPKDRRQEIRSLGKQQPYMWLCGCTCGYAKSELSEAEGTIAS
jgi:hypothetical protein